MSTLSIFRYAVSAASRVSNVTNAKHSESPVLWSRTTSHDTTRPNREKIISRSSSVVTGLSLQTNSDSSGGFASASGKSPIISSTTARFLASFSRVCRSTVAGSAFAPDASSGVQSSSSRVSFGSRVNTGDASGINAANPGGSSNGSSSTTVCFTRMFCHGRPRSSQYASLIASNTSRPSATTPNTVCFPSSASQSARAVMRNCDAFLFSPPPLAMDTVPFAPCFNVARISSSKKRAWSPYSLPYTESPPLPVPVGSPV